LTKLDLSSSAIEDESAPYLAEILQRNIVTFHLLLYSKLIKIILSFSIDTYRIQSLFE